MKVTVIGCRGGYPAAQEATSGYLLEIGDKRYLLDCGSAVVSQLQKYIDPLDVDALFLTHHHADHAADVGTLQHALIIQKALGREKEEFPIYADESGYRYYEELTHSGVTRAVPISIEDGLEIDGITVSFMRTVHPVPCVALKFTYKGKTVVYTGDSAYTEAFIPFSKDADVFIVDCNFYKGMDGSKPGHMTSEEVAIIAKEANVKQLVLSHLPHFGEHEQLLAEAKEVFTGPVCLATPGLELVVS